MLNSLRTNREGGFTLIELMIVIAIIGILAAIAIPQFSSYRKRSYDARAQADLRNAATAQEAYYIAWDKYADDDSKLEGEDYGFFKDEEVSLNVSGDSFAYTMRAWHPSGNYSFILTGPGGSISSY